MYTQNVYNYKLPPYINSPTCFGKCSLSSLKYVGELMYIDNLYLYMFYVHLLAYIIITITINVINILKSRITSAFCSNVQTEAFY